MAEIHQSIESLIGNTPLMRLARLEKSHDLNARLVAKLEYLNPAGSVKDRVALAMLEGAAASGKLGPGTTVIEPTSGNTGIGLAAVAAARGLKVIIVMPDSMSPERIQTMRAYGAEVILTPGAEGMAGAIRKADELAAGMTDAIIAGQFVNPANPRAHYLGTGPEIWRDTGGVIDIFVAGVGTGGTITGTGRYLKEKDPRIRIVAVEPADSPVLSGGKAGKHGLQGIGAGFVPEILDKSLLDGIVTVTEEEAYACGRELGIREGLLVGVSSGAALAAAIGLAKHPENAGKTIVVLLPDTGDRYLSTPLFA